MIYILFLFWIFRFKENFVVWGFFFWTTKKFRYNSDDNYMIEGIDLHRTIRQFSMTI